ncbi:erythromycin esterase family protein [Streptomyces sp. SP18CS02]|uniref:erythromycin esterase family protein n=1 Tax=Streptomyces sp. SP18CS02 TaxID=3002531 RepID=UPI002E7A807D|nr:erythromycin esterase family protein [Streptomyces sp. SP18CS02]MEE1754854.1 erythromycin esterase family protein [Streptomyces sp. SP18CS02]
MTGHRTRFGRRGLLAATAAVTATALLTPAAVADTAAPTADGRRASVVRSLERAAHPLRSTEPGGRTTDLRALDAMIGDAGVVGLGEATHGSHEFFAMKERVLRHLVETKGFTTFALEMSWSAGLTIDEYLQGGEGDARRIAEEALAGSPWEREEFVSLIAWMRDHNRRHPERKVHFMGDDIGAPRLGDRIFERVTATVRTAEPASLPRLDELYAGLRPMDDVFAYLRKPLAERRENAVRAQEALDLVTTAVGGGAAGEDGEWAVQHARNIAQTFAFTGLDVSDPASVSAAEHLRDRAMADNVLWWHRRTGDRMLLSAHNGHVGYLSTDPRMYPVTQGAYLRDALGGGYLTIGFTFNRGSFLTKDTSLGGDWRKTTVPPAAPGMHEHTLDRVRHRDFYLDLRTAPARARDWLNTARPVYDAGSVFHPDPPALALGLAYDVLIHLHRVREARPL